MKGKAVLATLLSAFFFLSSVTVCAEETGGGRVEVPSVSSRAQDNGIYDEILQNTTTCCMPTGTCL